MEEFREQNQKIKALETEILSVKSDSGRFAGSFPNLVRTESEPESEPARKRAFETAIIAQTRPLKRDYILHQILNLAEKGHYTTKQIENSFKNAFEQLEPALQESIKQIFQEEFNKNQKTFTHKLPPINYKLKVNGQRLKI